MAAKSPATAEANHETEEWTRYNPATQSFKDLLAESDEVLGYDLVKGEEADLLEKVPFLVTRVVYRPGYLRGERRMSYVTCEATIADEPTLKARRVNVETLPFPPESHVVFNDGSTGVYRQVTAFLEAKGFITLPEGPTQGPFGETKYDAPISEWVDTHKGEVRFGLDGQETYSADIRLFAPRGLRLSEYQSEHQPEGQFSKTRYFG